MCIRQQQRERGSDRSHGDGGDRPMDRKNVEISQQEVKTLELEREQLEQVGQEL